MAAMGVAWQISIIQGGIGLFVTNFRNAKHHFP